MLRRKYHYVYMTCIFAGSRRGAGNVRRHLQFVCNYNHLQDGKKRVLFVVSVRGDHEEYERQVTQALFEENTRPDYVDIVCLKDENWGMLVGALWDTWRFLKKENIKSKYVLACEDDWLFSHWPHRARLLKRKGYIYVGMFSYINMKREPLKYARYLQNGVKESRCDGGWGRVVTHFKPNKRIWTDGGLYFMKYDALQKMEDAMGVFTKAPRHFDKGIHGVDFGEVGFPTELHHLGFRFRAFTEAYEVFDGFRWVDMSSWRIKGQIPSYLLEDRTNELM